MKRILVIIISLFFMPIIANAETLTYNVCKNGCEYTNYTDVEEELYQKAINNEFDGQDIIINFQDNEKYNANGFIFGKINLTINGNNATINSSSYYQLRVLNANLNEININAEYIMLSGSADWNKLTDPEYNEYKNSNYIINNSSINALQGIVCWCGVYNINNTNFTANLLLGALSDIYLDKKTKIKTIISGYFDTDPAYDTNIYLPHDAVKNNIRINGDIADEAEALIEIPLSEEIKNYNITKLNNIIVTQEVNKTIKKNTSISEFESEFKNTYENSEGYDDIKDLPVEWKSKNESIATLDNGIIKPIANGQVDLVGTRGNDIYTIHLTVDMPAKKTNEKKGRMAPSTKITLNSVFNDIDISSLSDDVWEISNPSIAKIVNGEIVSLSKGETDIVATINGVKYIYHLTVSDTLVSKEIKVPITGKNIKLWIVVVGILLLSVIGTCTYILIKKK